MDTAKPLIHMTCLELSTVGTPKDAPVWTAQRSGVL